MPDALLKIVTVPGWHRLGIVHGFTERTGGVSPFPVNALNFGTAVGDDPGNVKENLHRLSGAVGLRKEKFRFVHQVHGDRVIVRSNVEDCSVPDADAQVTNLPGLVLTVLTADCVPVLFCDPEKHAVGVAHAGWRGTRSRIVARVTEAMAGEYGCNPQDLFMAMGPSIGVDQYEVDEDVAGEFQKAFPGSASVVFPKGEGKYHVDLHAANRQAALDAGLLPDKITSLGLCTYTGVDKFFSHRAEKGHTGRLMGFAVIPVEIK